MSTHSNPNSNLDAPDHGRGEAERAEFERIWGIEPDKAPTPRQLEPRVSAESTNRVADARHLVRESHLKDLRYLLNEAVGPGWMRALTRFDWGGVLLPVLVVIYYPKIIRLLHQLQHDRLVLVGTVVPVGCLLLILTVPWQSGVADYLLFLLGLLWIFSFCAWLRFKVDRWIEAAEIRRMFGDPLKLG